MGLKKRVWMEWKKGWDRDRGENRRERIEGREWKGENRREGERNRLENKKVLVFVWERVIRV